MSEPITITGEDNVRNASLLALRAALKLESHGMRRRGPSALTLTNRILGTKHRNHINAYVAINIYIVEKMGIEFDRPI